MDKVKKLVRAGATLSEAVQSALGEKSISRLAVERGVNRTNLTSGLNGGRALNDREIDALVAELGGSVEEWRQLLADAARKRVLVG